MKSNTQVQQNPFQQIPPDSNLHPIKSLNPYQNRWTIKARVTHKSEMRQFNTSKGTPGTLFNVDLLDSQGGAIRATMFNEAAEMFFPIFQTDEVYYISKGKLKPANKKYSSIKNEYELTLDCDSVVNRCTDPNTDIPKNHFSFTSIEDIQECSKDDVIDVIGIVTEMENVETITTKASKQIMKRNITIVDTSSRSIELTFWNTLAENPGFIASDHPVLAIKGAKVSDFKNRSLGTVTSTQIEINPDVPMAHQLRGWYDNQGGNITIYPLSKIISKTNSNYNGEPFGLKKSEERKTFSQIKDEGVGRGSHPDEFIVKGTVSLVKHENNIWYNACPTPKCNKKVTETGVPGQWECTKCNSTFNNYEPRYMLSLSASDHTGSAWLNAFNDVGKIILGKEASELVPLKDSKAEYESVFQNAVFKQYKFGIRAKVETYNNVDRVRCNIFSAQPLNFVTESSCLIQQIQRFS